MSSNSINPATLEFIQKENARRSRQRKIATAVGGLLLVCIAAGGYFGVRSWRAASQQATAKEIVAKAMANGPSREGFEQVRQAVESGQITWDQMRSAGREAFEKAEKERMTAYFSTPAKDRQKYLDKLIDDMQKMRAEWEARRAAQGPTTRPERRERPEGAPTTRPEGERGEQRAGMMGGRGDNMSPVDRAMNQEFRAALRRRMEERGIQGGGRGGWGGGRGMGGGGGR